MFKAQIIPVMYVILVTIWATSIAMANLVFSLVLRDIRTIVTLRLICIEASWLALMYIVLSSRIALKLTVPLATLLVVIETTIALTSYVR